MRVHIIHTYTYIYLYMWKYINIYKCIDCIKNNELCWFFSLNLFFYKLSIAELILHRIESINQEKRLDIS